MRSQKINQMNPSAPTPTKDPRQPQRALIKLTATGASMAPTFVPELKIPVASARSFFGNHSATALMLAGKTAASPSPNATREAAKLPKELASAVPMEATLQKTIAMA